MIDANLVDTKPGTLFEARGLSGLSEFRCKWPDTPV